MGSEPDETAALVALLRAGGRAWTGYVLEARGAGTRGVSAVAVLERELGLLSYEALANAEREIARWQARGYRVLPLSDPDYPQNLRVVENRPPLVFVAGELLAVDRRAVAVIGTRSPSERGLELAREVARALTGAGHTVVSGLAAGIDTAAHTAALELSARTIAVLGTGLEQAYPSTNATLQQRIAAHGALVSQFWPAAQPSRQSFPARNAVMSGLTLGSVIIEASERSGTRIQARHALAQGRLVVLMEPALQNEWACDLAATPGVLTARTADDVLQAFKRL